MRLGLALPVGDWVCAINLLADSIALAPTTATDFRNSRREMLARLSWYRSPAEPPDPKQSPAMVLCPPYLSHPAIERSAPTMSSASQVWSSAFHDIDHIRRVTREKSADILLDHRQRSIGISVVEATQMRCDNHVLHRPKRVIFGKRLVTEDIQRCPGDLAVLQRLDQCALVNHTTTRQIDEVAGRLHGQEYRSIHHVARSGRIRREYDEIVEIAYGEYELIPSVHSIKTDNGSLDGTDADHSHSHSLAFGSERFGNSPNSDNAHFLAVEETDGPAFPKMTNLVSDGTREITAQGEHNHNGRLGHRS